MNKEIHNKMYLILYATKVIHSNTLFFKSVQAKVNNNESLNLINLKYSRLKLKKLAKSLNSQRKYHYYPNKTPQEVLLNLYLYDLL
jgi:hypothetical protein